MSNTKKGAAPGRGAKPTKAPPAKSKKPTLPAVIDRYVVAGRHAEAIVLRLADSDAWNIRISVGRYSQNAWDASVRIVGVEKAIEVAQTHVAVGDDLWDAFLRWESQRNGAINAVAATNEPEPTPPNLISMKGGAATGPVGAVGITRS